MIGDREMGFQTDAIHGHGYFDEKHGAFIPPIYQTAMFEQPGWTRHSDRGMDLKYSREENPTVRALERVLAKLEGGEDSLGFSSGMAAISATYFALLSKGDRLVVPAEAYGTTIQLAQDLRKYGIEAKVAWPETDKLIDSIEEGTKLVLVETMTNPTLRVIDVPEIIKRCKEVDAVVVVDNTFVTPVLYRPLKDGASLVVHSLTKYLAGHNDVIAGAIIGDKSRIQDLWDWRRKLGSIIAPLEAFLVLRGLKTLELRVLKHCQNALAVAEFLKEHPRVKEVYYPGLPDSPYHNIAKRLFKGRGYGGVVSFKIKGGSTEVTKIMRRLKIIKAAPSLGGPESLMTYPIISAAKTIPEDLRKALGITEDLIRLSVGLEDLDDIIEDLDQALKAI